jgi:hypothetical protein
MLRHLYAPACFTNLTQVFDTAPFEAQRCNTFHFVYKEGNEGDKCGKEKEERGLITEGTKEIISY